MYCQMHKEPNLRNAQRCKVIACATVIEEMLPILPKEMKYEILDFGLHIKPEALKIKLQESVFASSKEADTILLGYGLCSQAVVGLKAENCTLVIPRVDDCIALFLGSVEAYKEQHNKAPGTYYLTKGWIEVGDTPFDEYESMINKYGKQKADCIFHQILKNYTRIAFISTGPKGLEKYSTQARNIAEKFNLKFEEIPGSDCITRQLIQGPWDDRFVVAKPGQIISFKDFRQD